VATQLALHVPATRTKHRVDYLGAALLGAGVACIVLLTTWGGSTYPWASPQILGLGGAGLVLLGAFGLVERSAPEPILPLRLFRSSVFTISCVVGFIVGLAMFGSIVFLPQYLQIVKALDATASGLLLVPMMAGLLVTSIVSGQLISRTGRYRMWPIMGTAVTALGMYLFSTMGVSTPLWATAMFMVVLGLGIGGVMQVLVLVAQNAVTQRDLGTATSTSTFFRAMGGSIGVPIFGAIYSNVLITNLARALPAGYHLGGLSGGAGNASPQVLAALPAAIHSDVVSAFARSLGPVFLVGVPIALAALLLVVFLKEVPLRTTTASMLEAAGDGVGEPSPAGLGEADPGAPVAAIGAGMAGGLDRDRDAG
jgi:hypothetical protein